MKDKRKIAAKSLKHQITPKIFCEILCFCDLVAFFYYYSAFK